MTTAHVHESPAEIVFELELPHVSADRLEITVLDHTVTVRGGQDLDPEGFGKHTAGPAPIHQELLLPWSADVEHLSATLRPDLLELRAPKRRSRPRRIPVRVPCRINGSAFAD
jgi:HSP20 family molecular chaperone IbpA